MTRGRERLGVRAIALPLPAEEPPGAVLQHHAGRVLALAPHLTVGQQGPAVIVPLDVEATAAPPTARATADTKAARRRVVRRDMGYSSVKS